MSVCNMCVNKNTKECPLWGTHITTKQIVSTNCPWFKPRAKYEWMFREVRHEQANKTL